MRVVSIGGGTGQSQLLLELKRRDIELTAIATTLDSGRNSGSLRDELGMFAPGDLRSCMFALSDSDELIKSVFQHRFTGRMEGMNIGNLLFAAIHESGADFDDALEKVSALFDVRGRIVPSTLDPVHIRAELADGSVLEKEHRIISERHAPISSIGLSAPARAHPGAIDAIANADLIIVGPGALFTSVAVHFAIDEIRDAFAKSRAYKVFVPNLAIQPNVTEGFSLTDHLEALESMLGSGAFDTVLVNTQRPSRKVAERYEQARSDPIIPDARELSSLSSRVNVVSADLLESSPTEEWDKPLSIRHDPRKLADALDALIHKPLKGLVLAAGKGTRMAPFSKTTPKVLLELYGKPLIAYRIEELIGAGVRDIVIVCSDETFDPIRSYFTEQRYPDVSFSYAIQRDARGPAHAIDCARDLIAGSRIVLTLADNLADEPLVPKLLKAAGAPGAFGAIVAKRVSDPTQFGVAQLEGERVVGIVEKPSNPPSDLAIMGTSVLDADVLLDRIAKRGYTVSTSDGEREISAPQYFTDAGYPLEVAIAQVRVLDVGRPYDLIEAMRLLARSGGRIDPRARIDPSASIDPDAYIGPDAVIGRDVRISGASQIEGIVEGGALVRDSLVMREARIGSRADIERCVIGTRAVVEEGVVIRAAHAPVVIKGVPMRPGLVGMFAGEGAIIDACEPGRIV